MQKYRDTVTGPGGAAIANASVLVKTLDGALATIYADNGVTVAANPLTTDKRGTFSFYAADGRYSLTISKQGIEPVAVDDILLEDPTDGSAALAAVNGTTLVKGTWFGGVVATVAQLASSIGASLIGFVQAGIGAVARSLQDELRERGISVTQFGADPTGVTNSTAAFAAASARIVALGGGKLIIPAGTYIVGQQTFAGATGKGYAYQAADIIKITGCTRAVIIESQGATLRVAAGLKFGSFDPVTGAAYTPGALPFTNADYAADIGNVLSLTNNAGGVRMIGQLEIDGNNTNLALGGQWGDTGYQRIAYGINETGNAFFHAENVYTHHNGTDGISCGYAGAVDGGPARPKTLLNVIAEYNGRNNLSWVGGIGFTAINCKFNRAGRAVNIGTGTTISSAPNSGIDIEAESAVNRRGTFINCESVNNGNTALVADSGDSKHIHFIGCKFAGIVWPNKPSIKFDDCRFYGNIVNQYANIDPRIATVFNDCEFSDAVVDDFTQAVSLGSNMFTTQLSAPTFLTRCTINATRQRPGRMDYFVMTDTRVNMSFPGTTAVNDKDFVATLNNATMRDCSFDSNITVSAPPNAFYIGWGAMNTSGFNNLTNTAGTVRWYNWSTGAGGFIGRLGNTGWPGESRNGTTSMSIFKNLWGTQYPGTIQTYANSAAPTSNPYVQGDRVLNQSPAVGTPDYWKCVTGGTPGTWVANRKRGTFTCAAAATTTVTDTDVQASSLILLMPKNAAAATLMGGATSMYVSTRTAVTSFVVATANGTPAAGTEQFEYELLN